MGIERPANVHVIREHTLRNIPAVLREFADAIERGECGSARGCVVVLDGDELHVSYSGAGEAAPNAFLLLHAAAAKMMKAVTDGRT